jgi:hypothetical protein
MKIKDKLQAAEHLLACIAKNDCKGIPVDQFAKQYFVAITAPSRVTFPPLKGSRQK